MAKAQNQSFAWDGNKETGMTRKADLEAAEGMIYHGLQLFCVIYANVC